MLKYITIAYCCANYRALAIFCDVFNQRSMDFLFLHAVCRFFTIFETILYILLDLVDDSSLSPSYEKSLDALHLATVY